MTDFRHGPQIGPSIIHTPAEVQARREIGPSITHTGGVNSMTQIATEDTYVEVDGIRRKVAAGAPIPGYLAQQMEVDQETVEARTLSTPVVDPEAALPQHERTQTTAEAAAESVAARTGTTAKKPAAAKRAAQGSASGS